MVLGRSDHEIELMEDKLNRQWFGFTLTVRPWICQYRSYQTVPPIPVLASTQWGGAYSFKTWHFEPVYSLYLLQVSLAGLLVWRLSRRPL